MRKISKIGVLTSGGDAPGMNPCIGQLYVQRYIMAYMLLV
jgi:6-phosphofructokinase